METNPLMVSGDQWNRFLHSVEETVDWTDPRLERVIRFRLLGDRDFPYLDVSYCYGRLKDGTHVSVSLPFHQLHKKTWRTDLVKWAKKDRVYAAGLGMFDNVSIFI